MYLKIKLIYRLIIAFIVIINMFTNTLLYEEAMENNNEKYILLNFLIQSLVIINFLSIYLDYFQIIKYVSLMILIVLSVEN